MTHAPTKDVTTTETVTDKDTTVTKVTRDHDELGKHVHTEVVDKVGPGGHTHTESTDVEKNGEQVHKEVIDKDGSHGEHVHQVVTNTDKGCRHVEKTVTDTDVNGQHIHEEQRVTTNKTLLGDGTVKRVVTDRDEEGNHHHEEVTTIDKKGTISTALHTVDDVVVHNMVVHETVDSIEAAGASKETHTIVTDKDIPDCHVHTEQVERLSEIEGQKRAVIDSKVVLNKADGTTVDVVHQEMTGDDHVTTHHIECDTNVKGAMVHEVSDVVTSADGVKKTHTIVTDKDIEGGHIHKEVVQTAKQVDGGKCAVVNEQLVIKKDGVTTVTESHKEAALKEDTKLGPCAVQHVVNTRKVDGAQIREVTDTVKVQGVEEQVRTIVTDKDIPDGHIHTEKVEKISEAKGVRHSVVDEAVYIQTKDNVTVDVMHRETTNGEEVSSVHHIENERSVNGCIVRETTDMVKVDDESKTKHVVITEEDCEGTHTYTEVVSVTDAIGDTATTVTDEKVIVCNTSDAN